MTKQLEQRTQKTVEYLCERIRAASDAGMSININELSELYFKDLRSGYLALRARGKAKISPELMEKYEAELQEARTMIASAADSAVFEFRKQMNITKIEFLALEHRVKERMNGLGIPYIFTTSKDKNYLTVRIVGDYFFRIPLTMENADRVMGMVKYFIHRPDYAWEEMPSIRQVRNPRLAASWDRITAQNK